MPRRSYGGSRAASRMFLADLTPYEYGDEMPRSNILNVGWLARGHVFPVGEVPPELLDAIAYTYYICIFCGAADYFITDKSADHIAWHLQFLCGMRYFVEDE